MSWIHTVVFGGKCEEVKEELDTSYAGYDHTVDCIETDQTGMITIESERGWSSDQVGVMTEAYLSGKVSWWSRWTN